MNAASPGVIALFRHNDYDKTANAFLVALVDIGQSKQRIHIRRGNYEGPHSCDIAMVKVFRTLMSTKA